MTDKEKIRKEVQRLMDELIQEQKNGYGYDADYACILELQNILTYIDSLQEESVSIWHDASEKPECEDLLIETNDGRIIHRQSINNYGMVKRWAYISVLLNLDNSCNFGKKSQKKTVSIDFEQELYKAFGQVKDFTLGMRIAKWFYDMGKNSQEPVSKDLDEAAKLCVSDYLCITGEEDWDDTTVDALNIFKVGAQWQKENLWKPADGDDLPEIDREVIALLNNSKVVFAHRPPEYWDGKDIVTGKVTRNYPKTYDKGGWNIPNVKYWLDVELPKEIEL